MRSQGRRASSKFIRHWFLWDLPSRCIHPTISWRMPCLWSILPHSWSRCSREQCTPFKRLVLQTTCSIRCNGGQVIHHQGTAVILTTGRLLAHSSTLCFTNNTLKRPLDNTSYRKNTSEAAIRKRKISSAFFTAAVLYGCHLLLSGISQVHAIVCGSLKRVSAPSKT